MHFNWHAGSELMKKTCKKPITIKEFLISIMVSLTGSYYLIFFIFLYLFSDFVQPV